MSAKNLFREVDSLLSYAEAKNRHASKLIFGKLKTVEEKTVNIRSESVKSFFESKSAVAFELMRTANRKIEELSAGYIEFLRPTTAGSYTPIGIDVDDIV